MIFSRTIALFALAMAVGFGRWCYADEAVKDTMGAGADSAADRKPAIELGGYMTVDYAKTLGDSSQPSFGIHEVDLGANVNISSEVVASVLIKTWDRLDSLWIDQAMVAYTPKGLPIELLFGQQTAPHGLLGTRLISDPLLLDMVELKKPAVVLSGVFDRFKAGLGLVALNKTEGDTVVTAVIVNVDMKLPEESLVRLSTLAYKDHLDVDCAGILNYKKCTFDFEGEFTLTSPDSDTSKPSGLYAGVQWSASERFDFAVRADVLSPDKLSRKTTRIGIGTTVKIKDGIFCALELSQLKPYSLKRSNEIALQIGLERTIALPGFQRKTLTND